MLFAGLEPGRRRFGPRKRCLKVIAGQRRTGDRDGKLLPPALLGPKNLHVPGGGEFCFLGKEGERDRGDFTDAKTRALDVLGAGFKFRRHAEGR